MSNETQKTCSTICLDRFYEERFCNHNTYQELIEYAFPRATHFMLVYFYETQKGIPSEMKEMKSKLAPFAVKTRHNSRWPGTNRTCNNHDWRHDIVLYKTVPEAKEILLQVSDLSSWRFPNNPEDLAFFKEGKCWLYSTVHEKMATCIRASKEDIAFFKKLGICGRATKEELALYEKFGIAGIAGIANRYEVQIVPEHFFLAYDETLK